MATISIPGKPSSLLLEKGAQLVTCSFTFDLSLLGSAPVVTSAHFVCDVGSDESLRMARDMGELDIRKVDIGSDVQEAITRGTTDFQLSLYAMHGPYITTVSNIALNVVIEGEVVVDDTPSEVTTSDKSVAFGASFTTTVHPANDNFTHSVRFTLGTHTQTEALSAGTTEISFTVPSEWMDAVPSAAEGTLGITVTTYNLQEESIGDRSAQVVVTVPNTVKPTAGTMAVTAINTGALVADARYFKGATSCAIALTGAAAGTGSSIKSIVYSGWGSSATTTSTTYTTDPVSKSGTVTIKAVITDSRDRTAQVTQTIQVLNYKLPAFTSIVVARCSPDGTESDQGTTAKVKAQFTYDTQSIDNNSATASVALRQGRNGNWSTEHALTNNVETILTGVNLASDYSYTLRFTVTDTVTHSEAFVELPSSVFVIHFNNDGHSVAIGQAAEPTAANESGRFAVNPDWTVYLGENIYIGNQTLTAYIQDIIAGGQ